MPLTEPEIFAAALALPAPSKIQLIERLLDSVDPIDQAAIDEVWRIEIERRIKEYEAGQAATIPASKVLKPRRP